MTFIPFSRYAVAWKWLTTRAGGLEPPNAGLTWPGSGDGASNILTVVEVRSTDPVPSSKNGEVLSEVSVFQFGLLGSVVSQYWKSDWSPPKARPSLPSIGVRTTSRPRTAGRSATTSRQANWSH